MRFRIKFALLSVSSVCIVSLFAVSQLAAQSTAGPWTAPVNISKSGAASQPVLAVANDGSLHALWWDALAGERYARTTTVSATTWTEPLGVPQIYGRREVDFLTGRVSLQPPREIQLVTTQTALHALWISGTEQLLSAQAVGGNWGAAVTLAESAVQIDTAADAAGTLRLAYLRASDSSAAPAGVYYRSNDGGPWSGANLVTASPYFRVAPAQSLHVSVAGNQRNEVVVVWNDPQTGNSRISRSTNNGIDWSEPVDITGTQAAHVQNAHVAAAVNGDFLLLWHEGGNAGGCGYSQSLSTDGGQTWSAPIRVLSSSSACQPDLRFMTAADDQLWLVGRATGQTSGVGSVTLAAWNGQTWSDVTTIALNYFDQSSGRSIVLSCLNVAVADQTAGLIGCDAQGDVWAVRNETPLSELVARLQPVWSSLELVSDRGATQPVIGLPALTADAAGNLYALWAQSTGPQANTVLAASLANDGRWTRASTVLRSPLVTGMSSSQAAQPAITLSTEEKIHAVWTAGALGPVYHSWAYARDFTSAQIWLEPVALPSPSANASAPDIASDPRRPDLYVVYAVPYNEARGVYMVHSPDGGATWLTPTLVFDAIAAQWPSIDKARIALDPVTNVLHVTWLRTALPGVPSTQAVYYALSVDQGRTWSSAVKIAEGAVDWPRIVVSNANQVYLAWTQRQGQSAAGSAVPDGVWGTSSNDGGARWSNPSPVSGFGEVSGPIGLYANGTGPLYLVAVGQDVGNQSALLWAQWNGQSWNPREVLPLGQGPAEGNAAAVVYTPATAQLSAVLRLQVWDQDSKGRFEVATTSRRLEPLAFTPVPTFTPMPTNTPTVVPTPEPTATPRPQLPTSSNKPAGAGSGTSPLILGGVLAAVIVAAAVTGAMIVRKR